MVNVAPSDNNGKLSNVVASALESLYHRLAPDRAAERLAHVQTVLDAHEADFRKLIPPVFSALSEHPDFPEEARAVFATLAEPEHFAQASILLVGIYPIVAGFVQAAIAPYTQDISNLAWAAHTSMPLSADDVALAILRNNLNGVNPYDEAAKTGVPKYALDIMALNTGDSLPIEEALLLYRRKFLDDTRLQKAVRQSRMRDEWFDAVVALRYPPPGVAEVIAGRVKGHLEDGDARTKTEIAGLDPAEYDWLLATAGRPPGVEEMTRLFNRGKATEQDFADAVAQSDIQDKWCAQLFDLRVYVPPVRSINAMLKAGAIQDGDAEKYFRENGVPDDLIAILIAEGHAPSRASHHDLSQTQIRQAYLDGLTPRDTAISQLEALGYPNAVALEIIALADDAATLRVKNATIAHTGSLFTRYRLTENDASNALDAIGVQASVRDQLITLWTIQRDDNRLHLTLAQLQGLWHRGVISDAQFDSAAIAMGHQESDLQWLKALALPPSKFATERSVADL